MKTSRGWWALVGVLVGLLGLATSYLAAGILNVRESPVVAVAEGVTALTPGPVVEWAISTFQHDDKTVLVVGILLLLVGAFALVGVLGRARWWLAMLGYAVLAGIASLAVLTKPTPGLIDVAPILVGLVTWILALAVLGERLRRWQLIAASGEETLDPAPTRRSFLTVLGALAGVSVVSGLLGRVAGSARRRAEESRRLLRLEGVTAPDAPDGVDFAVPAGTEEALEGLSSWATESSDFYLIDTAFIKPTIKPADWTLRIHGMVERELTISYADLVSREITEDWITLNCVSNEVGGGLISNAWWSGVRVASLLAEARPLPGADAVLQTSEDGWNCGTPLAALTDDRNALLAVAMNGEPLPIEHGFPVRTIVPGLYGYVSATKWVVDMEVTRFADISAYWTEKGWAERGPVKISSRIDVPRSGADVMAGEVVVAGMAWFQQAGIARVEVQVDGGRWRATTLAATPNLDTWVQWRTVIDIGPGEHQLRVRAVGADGETQTGAITGVLPDGATGWHTIDITAKA